MSTVFQKYDLFDSTQDNRLTFTRDWIFVASLPVNSSTDLNIFPRTVSASAFYILCTRRRRCYGRVYLVDTLKRTPPSILGILGRENRFSPQQPTTNQMLKSIYSGTLLIFFHYAGCCSIQLKLGHRISTHSDKSQRTEFRKGMIR